MEVFIQRREVGRESLLGDDNVHVVQVVHDELGLPQGLVRLAAPVVVDLAFPDVDFFGPVPVVLVDYLCGQPFLYLEIVLGHCVGVVYPVGEPLVFVHGSLVTGSPGPLELLHGHNVLGLGGLQLCLKFVQVLDGVSHRVLGGLLVGGVLVRGWGRFGTFGNAAGSCILPGQSVLWLAGRRERFGEGACRDSSSGRRGYDVGE